jgi:hypothetical protein
MFKYGLYAGASLGLSLSAMILAFTLAMWYGSECVKGTDVCQTRFNSGNHNYTTGDILVILYCLLFPAVNLSQLAPTIQKIF